jgi:hypothetical protein
MNEYETNNYEELIEEFKRQLNVDDNTTFEQEQDLIYKHEMLWNAIVLVKMTENK